MRRILVTGSAGFIGSHLCDALLARGDTVYSIDSFNNYYVDRCGIRFKNRKEQNLESARQNTNFIELKTRDGNSRVDITREEHLAGIKCLPPLDAVVHLAARAGVRASFIESGLYQKTNVNGTRNIIEQGLLHGVGRFIIASSSSVYGNSPNTPWVETDSEGKALNPYAQTKRDMEELCARYKGRASVALFRFFTVLGPRGRPDMAPYLFVDFISRGEEIHRFGDGSSQRDYTYVGDVVAGLIKAIDTPVTGTFNLCNSRPVSLNDFIQICAKAVGKEAKIKQQPLQRGDAKATHGSPAKALEKLGWKPKTSVEEGVRKLVEWYKKSSNP